MRPTLGIGSWWSDDMTPPLLNLRWRTYAARYRDGWVIKATR